MQFFVLNKNVITGVIHTHIEMHRKSSKYIPTTKESLAVYNNWLTTNPNKQPSLADIFASKPAPAKSITNATTTNVSKPLNKEEADKKAMVKQFKQFIINKH
ncbi:hypothetical protein [Pseudomonas sp. 8O]|uniref:hypothetical protein n=1 Tax=Pseudomonas sp. 8O TaxID=2653165 RepID=UPI0012F43DB0|nr:hypothetical protein [Pseudomonas sp. 8O]VXB44328.1 hypothetical protein PSEUDO8O_150101 [Pseudomonas sp. 8O]